jgi:hypothetical protein
MGFRAAGLMFPFCAKIIRSLSSYPLFKIFPYNIVMNTVEKQPEFSSFAALEINI